MNKKLIALAIITVIVSPIFCAKNDDQKQKIKRAKVLFADAKKARAAENKVKSLSRLIRTAPRKFYEKKMWARRYAKHVQKEIVEASRMVADERALFFERINNLLKKEQGRVALLLEDVNKLVEVNKNKRSARLEKFLNLLSVAMKHEMLSWDKAKRSYKECFFRVVNRDIEEYVKQRGLGSGFRGKREEQVKLFSEAKDGTQEEKEAKRKIFKLMNDAGDREKMATETYEAIGPQIFSQLKRSLPVAVAESWYEELKNRMYNRWKKQRRSK